MKPKFSPASVPIIGAWKLISCEVRNSDGGVLQPFGEKPQGSIIYTESGRFSAQVMRSDRPRFVSGDQMKGTREEMEANYKGIVSYYGPYEFHGDEGIVVHHVEGSLFPNWEGEVQKRFFELSGNQLKVSSPPILLGGGEMVITLLWDRA